MTLATVTVSQIDYGIKSLKELVPLFKHEASQRGQGWIYELLLHSNDISHLDASALAMIANLSILDLSSNFISSMSEISCLKHLKILNLSNNKITKIQGLWPLNHLLTLNLSFNYIQELDGLVELHGNHHSLNSLDIKGNYIQDLDQLQYLVGLCHLRELILASDLTLPCHNKFIQDQKYSRIKVFNLVPQLMGIDGFDRLGNAFTGINASESFPEMNAENIIHSAKESSTSDRNLSEKLELIENYITNLSDNVKQASENSNNTQILDQLSLLESQIKDLKDDKETKESQKRIDGLENILKEIVNKLNKKETNYLKEYVDWRKNNIDAEEIMKDSSSKLPKLKNSLKDKMEVTKKVLKSTQNNEIHSELLRMERDNRETVQKKLESSLSEIDKIHEELKNSNEMLKTLKKENCALLEKNNDLMQSLKEKEKLVDEFTVRIKNLELLNSELQGRLQAAQDETPKISINKLLSDLEDLKNENDKYANTINKMEEQSLILMHDNSTIKSSLSASKVKMKSMEEEKSRISLKYLKERESFKIKMAQMEMQDDFKKKEIRTLHDELQLAKSSLADIDIKYQKRLNDALIHQKHNRHESASEQMQIMISNHRQQLDESRSEYIKLQNAYNHLENEFRNHFKDEKDKYDKVLASHVELQRIFNDQQLKLSEYRKNEEEYTAIIKELTSLAKDQKARLREFECKLTLSANIYDEKCHEYEELETNFDLLKSENDELKNKNASHSSGLESLSRQISELEHEKSQLSAKIKELEIQINSQNPLMLERIDNLEKEVMSLEKQNLEFQQTIKIKNQMLDDQNDSIKKLKNNLENKVRESSISNNENSKREIYWSDKLEAERNISFELKKDLENQQTVVNHFQSIVGDYKIERDSLRKELEAVSQKLSERNNSINMIELEVKKVTDAFKRKEISLIQEREEAIRKKDAEHLSMKAQKDKFALFENEREALIRKIKDLEAEYHNVKQERDQYESEVKVLIGEMDKQKEKMDEKLTKLKTALEI